MDYLDEKLQFPVDVRRRIGSTVNRVSSFSSGANILMYKLNSSIGLVESAFFAEKKNLNSTSNK